MSQNAISYVIVKKNNKFCPRINSALGSNWFKEKSEYDTLEEAKEALIKLKQEREENIRNSKEEIVKKK